MPEAAQARLVDLIIEKRVCKERTVNVVALIPIHENRFLSVRAGIGRMRINFEIRIRPAMYPLQPPPEPKVKYLDTQRLSIHIDTEATYRQMFETADDAALKAHFGIASDRELDLQKGKLRGGLTTYRTAVLFFHLKAHALNRVIGSFAFHNWYPEHRRSEIGYAITDEASKGQGYMREAIAAIIPYGFKELELNRMEAFIHPENMPSIKLVLRAGFLEEGRLREHYCKDGVTGDSLVYGLLHKDWNTQS